ncbi:glutamine synthetase [Pseudolabrys sp. Root1462]|uniref:glutamine synthetase family protein n=1 Tax=Pseudolabrys sp. Root1462 TaxID=1736466 RepID=UPI000703A4CC|nr:glutamine synthetase family protein [Pseudolabrys sp. Root1462]KQY97715.1 glutamine synthetase [Pseudolabrys sp. Root1462]
MAPRKATKSSDSFVSRHGLWSAEQARAAAEVDRAIKANKLEVVRFSFADQHGVLRGKTLLASEVVSALRNGVNMTSTLLAKDTAHKSVFPVFTAGGGFGMAEMQGGADFTMIADPTTFRILPWANKTGWLLCDIYFTNGKPVPFSTRTIYRDALSMLGKAGYDFLAGLEVEFYLFRLDDPKLTAEAATWPPQAPEVSLLTQGYQYLTESRFDMVDPAIEILRKGVEALGLPLRSVELELGPSQVEFTFRPQTGLEAADTMILFRAAVKQIARRNGYLASFMCRPGLPNVMSSGWHLHQSLIERGSKRNAFVDPDGLSTLGKYYLGGLLAHARAAAAFTTPTVNGYKRYRPYSLAPDRAIWARDNRGVMMRLLGEPGASSTHLENRVGEPAANPYLYMASQIYCGLDGIARKLDPGASADTPYETAAALLPKSLSEAVTALRADETFRAIFGAAFIDYYAHIKDAERERFEKEEPERAHDQTIVTPWEQKEYLDLF